MGPTTSPSARRLGRSGRPGAHRARARLSGESRSIARASRIPSSASASRTAAPVRPGRCARAPRRRGAACISRRRSALTHSRRPGPGRRVRRGGKATNVGRGAKGRARKGCGPLAGGAAVFGAWRRPTYSTSRSLPRSILIGLSRGSMSARGPRHAPRALRHWHLCTTCLRSLPASEPLIHSLPRCFTWCRQRMSTFTTKIVSVTSKAEHHIWEALS
jgi:hypothetical protein